MKYREIEVIEWILSSFQPKKCLEWGSGYSTLYFPLFLKKKFTWISIEHDYEWSRKIIKMNKNRNVKILNIQPNHYPWSDIYGDGTYFDLCDYLKFPQRFGKFDFILIDGRARVDCLIMSFKLVKNKGLVILHDANRKYYRLPNDLFNYQLTFKDYRVDAGGLWIGSKTIKMEDILNLENQKEIWRFYSKFGSLFRL